MRGRLERLRFRRAPLLAATLCFALGEAMARSGWRPGVVLLAAVLLLAVVSVVALRRGMRVVLVPVAGLWMVVGMWCAEDRPAPSPQRALLGFADALSREARGHVVRVKALPPRADAADADTDGWRGDQDEETAPQEALQVDVQVEAVEYLTPDVSLMVPVEGGVRATLIADGGGVMPARATADSSPRSTPLLDDKQKDGQPQLPELRCGDEVEAPMRMREPERYRDPGAWQYADYLLSQGMAVHASVHAAKLRVTGHDAATMACRVQAAQSWAAGRVLKYVRSRPNRMLPRVMRLTADDAGMLNAMLFGDRGGAEPWAAAGLRADRVVPSFCGVGHACGADGRWDLLVCAQAAAAGVGGDGGDADVDGRVCGVDGIRRAGAAGVGDDGDLSGGPTALAGAECAECAGGGGAGSAGAGSGGVV